jgi:hypothetical protein
MAGLPKKYFGNRGATLNLSFSYLVFTRIRMLSKEIKN